MMEQDKKPEYGSGSTIREIDKPTMEWIKLTKENEPEGEVLCANFQSKTYGYKEKIVGYLSINEEGYAEAENEHEVLENVTHFIDLKLFDL